MSKIKKAEVIIYRSEIDSRPTVINSNLVIKQILDQKLADLEKTRKSKIKIVGAKMEKDISTGSLIINVEYEVRK